MVSTGSTLNRIPGTGVLVYHNGNHNVGHAWGDIIWPAFQMLSYWERQDSNFSFVLLGHDIHKHTHLFSSLSHNQVYRHDKQESICFDEVLVGDNGMSYSEGLTNPTVLKEFRNFIFSRYGVPISFTKATTRVTPNILIFQKEIILAANKCSFGNLKDIQNMFVSQFPMLNVTTVSLFDVPSISQQINMMTDVDIVLSLPGSDVMNALFLRDKSTLVLPCRKVVLVEPSNESRIWFRKFAQLRVIEFCGENDVKFQGNFAMLNISSLKLYIGQAIEDWYARHKEASNN